MKPCLEIIQILTLLLTDSTDNTLHSAKILIRRNMPGGDVYRIGGKPVAQLECDSPASELHLEVHH